MSHHSPVTRPRGPLPPQVYWFRRALVLGLALLLVGGLVLLVSSFGGGSDTAVTAAAPASPSASATPTTPTTATATASSSPTAAPTQQPTATASASSASSAPLSASKGTCETKDVTVRGAPSTVVGGRTVTVPLVLTTTGDPCTLQVSSRSVVAKITSGDDRIWSSQDCPAGIPATSVVVRPTGEPATRVNLTWSGRRSTDDCAGGQAWAKPGTYHLVTAALGGQQTDQQFSLGVPPRPVVTETATPTPRPKAVATPKG